MAYELLVWDLMNGPARLISVVVLSTTLLILLSVLWSQAGKVAVQACIELPPDLQRQFDEELARIREKQRATGTDQLLRIKMKGEQPDAKQGLPQDP